MTSYSGVARRGGGKNDSPKRGGGNSSKVECGKGSQGPAHQPNSIILRLTFYVRIEPLSPNYDNTHGEPIQHGGGGHWVPPNTPNGLRNGQGPALLLRWEAGNITIVPGNDPIQGNGLDNRVYGAATVFTQNPDTPHLLAVPFDARARRVDLFGRGWHRITFNHIRVGSSTRYYSYISNQGAEPSIAAPRAHHWTPEFLPPWYDCVTRHGTRTQAGLIGELPLLFALAAFSAPPTSQDSLLRSIAPGRWISHGQNTGHIAERGMVVTIYTDPSNPAWSTPQLLNRLQNGEFGPFYGP